MSHSKEQSRWMLNKIDFRFFFLNYYYYFRYFVI